MVTARGRAPGIFPDTYYSLAAARYCFPVAAFALVNGAAVLRLASRLRHWTLWLVLAGALLALAFMAWQFRLLTPDDSFRVPDYSAGFVEAYERNITIGRLLFWPALAATALGWAAWLAARARK